MKRILVALVVGGLLVGVVFAAAANLIVDAGYLQAGEDDVLMCDPDSAGGVQIYFRTGAGPGLQWDPVLKDFVVDHVLVGGLHSDCDGLVLKVVLTDINGDKIADGSMVVLPRPPADTNPSVPVSPAVSASLVYDVHVLLQQ